jgi:hypothetical protein
MAYIVGDMGVTRQGVDIDRVLELTGRIALRWAEAKRHVTFSITLPRRTVDEAYAIGRRVLATMPRRQREAIKAFYADDRDAVKAALWHRLYGTQEREMVLRAFVEQEIR